MSSASLPQLLDYIYRRRVQRCRCAKASSMCEFFVGNINGRDDRSQPHTHLHRQVTQATDAKDGQTLARLDFGVAESTINGYSRTEKRSSIDTGKPVRNLQCVTSGSLDKFCVPSVHGYAGNLLFDTEILIALPAERAFSAGPRAPHGGPPHAPPPTYSLGGA